MEKVNYLILGAGPTGLGAAWRFQEAHQEDWLLLEKESYAGGLATSFVDQAGFTWDIGGHVQFSHYHYFDQVMQTLIPADGWWHHQRESWVWMRNRFIPYPLQNNLRYLPEEEREECLAGLRSLEKGDHGPPPADFRSWILSRFGDGLARSFLFPYNEKVWAWPPERMNAVWVGERVAPVDLTRIEENIRLGRDDVSWGPNATFAFPRKGGTGSIWQACARRLPADKLGFEQKVVDLDPARRIVRTADGREIGYQHLLSTIPLPHLLAGMGWEKEAAEARAALLFSSSHIFGVGLEGPMPSALKGKCWMYFPEDNCPFYRVTVFSHYASANVPHPDRQWSLMVEVASSAHRPLDPTTIRREVLDGLAATGLTGEANRVVSFWSYTAPYGYPTPSGQRDDFLAALQPRLEAEEIYSRGRFGGWKYEVSNQDHSFMQGVEWTDRMLRGTAEETYFHPSAINGSGKR